MKRTPLQRFTPLKPGKCKLKRTGRLRPVSKAKAKRDRANKPMLDEYRRKFPLCQCGCRRKADAIHEIFGGPCRQKSRECRSCILHLANEPCHRLIQYWPKAKQLALKLWADPCGFDLYEANEVRGHSPISIVDVDSYMPETH